MFSLVEVIAGVAIVALGLVAAFGAVLGGTGAVTAPAVRDQTLLATRNAVTEARAAAAFDNAAASAILSGPRQSWAPLSGLQLSTSIDSGALVLVGSDGSETVRMRYPVVRETLPQGAIVDLHGNPAGQ